MDLYDSDPANYHGEGLASDFFNPSGQSQFTPWTNPNTDLPGNASLPTNLAVTNITSNGNSMSLDAIFNFFSGTISADSWWIYNLNGQLVRELLHEYRVAGEHTTPWDGRDDRGAIAASGVYFIRFETGNEAKISKVMLVR